MFGRRKDETPAGPVEPEHEDPRAPKGRPTPSRKDAEAARKAGLLSSTDPKTRRRLEREEREQSRQRSRQGMLAGDERYLPARDRGPAKAMTRDFVDSRFSLAEYFIIIAVVVLVMGFVRDARVQLIVSYLFFLLLILIAIDVAILLFALNAKARREFPNKDDRRGITLYASLRVLQLRRLRLPPPRVRRGGRPVTPKK